jgi:hypothetical protein
MNQTTQTRDNHLTVKFHGDYVLENYPLTLIQAALVYQSLPHLLGPNYEKATPQVVYLYPIAELKGEFQDQMMAK